MRIQRKGLLPRKEFVRDARLIIIATEGSSTEKQYFEGRFGSSRLKVEVLATAPDGLSAPGHVLARLTNFEDRYELGDGDERWLMVDVDRMRPEFMSQVCQEATQKTFGLAISNPCFELWLLLHFRDPETQDTNCNLVEQRLRRVLGHYNKSRIDHAVFTIEAIRAALVRAKRLNINDEERWPSFPGTHVYRIVERILDHFRTD